MELPDEHLSGACSFCETPLVKTDGEREPVDLVAPFDLTRRVAGQRLECFLQDQRWAPESVRKGSRPEELSSVLVPFYCYDAVARSTYEARVGLYWYRTETYTVIVNGRIQTRTRRVRETEWFDVAGTHVKVYDDHLVSGSRGLPEAEANELEPFDLGRARPFDPTMLAGLVAEVASVDHSEAAGTARKELANLENAAIRTFLPGDTTGSVSNQTTVEVSEVRLVMLPVWVGTFKFKGKVFRLLVNGQTGEVVGTVPKSWAKIGCAVAVVLSLLAAAAGCVATVAGLARYL